MKFLIHYPSRLKNCGSQVKFLMTGKKKRKYNLHFKKRENGRPGELQTSQDPKVPVRYPSTTAVLEEEVLCCFLCTPMVCISSCTGWSFPSAFPLKAVVQNPRSWHEVFTLMSSVGWVKNRVWHKGFDLRGKIETFLAGICCWGDLLRTKGDVQVPWSDIFFHSLNSAELCVLSRISFVNAWIN